MKHKDLKALAKRIANAETKLENCSDSDERRALENEIFELSSKITSLEDIMELDEMVQEILLEN